MPKITIITGGLLIVLGIGAYVLTHSVSVTALIPAFFGIVLLALGGAGLTLEAWRKHAMHAAVGVALLGVVLTIGSLRFALYMASVGPIHVDNPGAVITRSIMAVCCGAYVYCGIRSFLKARRKRA